MNAFERNVILRVVGIHVAIILFVLITSSLKGCFRPKPKPEIVTFIEFGAPAPQVSIEQVAQMSEPEPPAPAPEPEPEPVPVPEPPKPKPTPKPKPKPTVEKPKPKPEPVKPKWKPTSVKDIKMGKKVNEAPSKPVVTSSEIKKALSGISTPSGATGNPSQNAAYISQIGSFFDRRWTKPHSSSPSASAVVRIYISKWGTITRRTKIQGSGDSAFDASVMSAVNSVSTVPKPPSDFPYDYVEVEFRIRN